jgi:hypothetical protein
MVVGYDLGVTFPYLVPSLGVLASWGVAYRSAVQLVYNLLGLLLATRLCPYNISI